MRQLEQAKTAFPNTYLMVGVTGDSETHRRKGLTVLSARERAETVRHCRWVDEVVEDCPWIVTPAFLTAHNIDYVAHDDIPYGADEGDDIYGGIKKAGKFLVTQRTEGVSTTGIITKIVRDYEQYISRQLKRGTSRQELNISWLKKNEIDIKRHATELREAIRTNWSTTGQELQNELKRFWQPSRPGSPAPGMTGLLPPRRSTRRSDAASISDSTGHLSPPQSLLNAAGIQSPRGAGASDFATGYSLGLVGGIRSWMTRNRRNVISLRGSRPGSPTGETSGSDREEVGAEGDEDVDVDVDLDDVGEVDEGRRGRSRVSA